LFIYFIAPTLLSQNRNDDMQDSITNNTNDDMIDSSVLRLLMGDFTQAESLPKMMSRVGQCFSQALVCCRVCVFKRNYV
jgi:hypothetical protein